jgi:hypothetical protein
LIWDINLREPTLLYLKPTVEKKLEKYHYESNVI